MAPPGKPRLRAGLYGRVSDDRAGQSKSVDSQLDFARRRAAQLGADIAGEWRDDGIGASRHGRRKVREDWEKAMAAIESRAIDILITWEISRNTRDREVWAKLIGGCIAQDVLLDVGGKSYDPRDADEAFQLDLSAMLAVREAAITSQRVRRGLQTRAEDGLPHGRIHYGYRREYDPRSGALLAQIPDEHQAAIIREIAQRLLAGETGYSIATDLNTREVPSPAADRLRRLGHPTDSARPWDITEIRRQATSPTVAGLRQHRGVIVGDGNWEPLIPPSTREQLLARTADRQPGWGGPAAAKYLLSGIAVCGVCGAKCRRVLNRGCPSYACFGLQRRGDSCVCRRQNRVDRLVANTIIGWAERPGILAELTDTARDTEVAAAAREAADIRAKLAELETAAATPGGLSIAAFGRIETRLLAHLDDAERRAVPAHIPAVVTDLVGPDARNHWAAMSTLAQRQTVSYLLEVTILPVGRHGSKVFDPSRVQIRRQHRTAAAG